MTVVTGLAPPPHSWISDLKYPQASEKTLADGRPAGPHPPDLWQARAPMAPPRRLLWLILPGLGLLELGAHVYFRDRAPSVAEWHDVVAEVRKLRTPGDVIVVSPPWAEPLARHVLGDEAMPLRDVARPDTTAYAQAVEISVLGQTAAELREWRVASERANGKFRLRVLENPSPAAVRFDFVDRLTPDHLSVSEITDGTPAPCAYTTTARVTNGGLGGNPTFPARRFDCPSGEWFFVGETVIDDQDFRPRRCIWAHPTPGGPLRLRYANVPLGEVIRGHGGLPWLLFRDGIAGRVELEVRVAGRSVGVHAQTSAEWTPFSFPTGAAGQTADVEIEVRADNVKDKHFCFQADTR